MEYTVINMKKLYIIMGGVKENKCVTQHGQRGSLMEDLRFSCSLSNEFRALRWYITYTL